MSQVSKLERYPIPKIEGLLTRLAGGKTFTKLDFSQAYLQIPLDESSKTYDSGDQNTHKGLFQFNRLPNGVSSSSAIFQRVMERHPGNCHLH